MFFQSKPHSLLRDVTLFIGVIIMMVAGALLYRIETIQSEAMERQLASQAERVENYFTERVVYTESSLRYMGRRIQQYTPVSQEEQFRYIDNLFQSFSIDSALKDFLSFTIVGWVTTDFQATVDGVYRVMDKPIDLSSRDYIHETAKQPWAIKLGQPVIGSTSGEWIIPAGVGVTDPHGTWIGTLVIGFQQSFLQQKFKQLLDNPILNVALMDMTGQVLVEAPNHFISNTVPIKDKIMAIPFPGDDNSAITPGNTHRFSHIGYFGWGTSYYYYKIPGYNYVMLISANNPLSRAKLGALLVAYLPAMMAIITCLTLGALFLKRRIVTPIITLSDAAMAMSEGKSDIAIPVMHHLEGHRLAQALERVKALFASEQRFKAELEAAHASIQQANDALEQKVSERTQALETTLIHVKTLLANEQRFKEALTLAHAEAQRANDSLERKVIERTQALERALAVKSEFIDNISHEIRSPVQGVTVISSGLVENWEHIAEERRFIYVQEVHKSGERLLSLVNNLLDFSRMNAGKMEFALMPGSDMVALVKANMATMEPLAARKKLLLALDAPPMALAEFDQLRIGQVIRNLLSNAIKFTDYGTITLTIATHTLNGNDAVAVTVRDEGPGIPENEREQVFEPFSQSSRTKTRAGGTGLGLTLCAEIIMAHHGLIYVENTQGKGAAFTFIIPIHHTLTDLVARRPAMQEKNHPINVLAVDDEVHCLMSMRIILEGGGYNVIEAQGGAKALEYLEATEERVDIILLDMMMPDIYGTEVLVAIKQNVRFQHIPVIIQSGVASDTEISNAMQYGAHGHIRKPYNRALLLEAIGTALQSSSSTT